VARAGLSPSLVTEAGATLVDEVGFAQLSMGLLADRLGVKAPSLYKHVSSQADLADRIAILALTELGDVVREATQGRAGGDALAAAAQAMRMYVREHPGRYAAINSAGPDGPDGAFTRASNRAIGSLAAVLRGYHLDPAQEIHALRMLRSALDGFSTLEVSGGFHLEADIDDSFTWMITFIDLGLRTTTATRTPQTPSADTRVTARP
jgi:AcrR family transcriptional regulator